VIRRLSVAALVRRSGIGLLVAALAGVALLAPAPASAQSVVAGSVEGELVDEAGVSLRGARVALLETRTAISRATMSGPGGDFGFAFVPPGEYTLHVEALGFRPRFLTGVPVGPGETVRVRVELTGEAPPVTRVDTVAWSASAVGGAWPGMGRRVSAEDIVRLPDVRFGLAPLIELDTHADRHGGYQGRPAGATVLISEGEPFRSAGHPTGLEGPIGLPFPRTGVSGLDVLQGVDDIEWNGGDGGVVPVRTRPPARPGLASGYALGSGGGMWSGSAVDDPPSLVSFWGGADVAIPLLPDTSTLFLAAEGGRVQTARPGTVSDTLAAQLLGDADPGTGIDQLTVASGMARVDWALTNGGQVTARAGFSTYERTLERPQGPGVYYGLDTPSKGTDASVSGSVSTPLTEEFYVEVRGSLGFSSRDYEPTNDVPGAFVVGRRARVGTDPSFAASVQRLDIGGGPAIHYLSGPHRVKFGVRVDVASHEMTWTPDRTGMFSYGEPNDLLAGQGWFSRALGVAPTAEFSAPAVSLYGQYRWNAAPGLDFTTGARFTRHSVPVKEVRPAIEWTELTGSPNDPGVSSTLDAFDGRVHVQWDVQGNRRSWVTGGLALQHGPVDPFALAEWLTLDGGVRVQRGLGGVGSWPTLPDSASAPVVGTRLAIMNADLSPPRTLRGSAALVRQLTPGVSLGVSGTFRRTESLIRRTDLNLLPQAAGSDQFGRPVYGELLIVGGVLGADPATSRRFQGFEHVWGLEPDGWSEYRAFSFFMDMAFPAGVTVGTAYTYSETTDNLVGAASGRPDAQLVPQLPDPDWADGISDFDSPHRVTATASFPLPGGGALSGIYQYRSGLPFTPMVAAGLDANGDGSFFNDPAFVPASGLDENALGWDCVGVAQGTLAVRNGCRGDGVHRVDLRLSIGLGAFPAQIVVDALNVTDVQDGVRDDALLLLEQGGAVTGEGDVTVPYRVNPGFGTYLFRTDPGRMLRVGIRLGGGS
jgi:hypothetical protein